MELNNADENSAEGRLHNSVTEPASDHHQKNPEKTLEQPLQSQELQTGLGECICVVCSENFPSLLQLAKHMQFHDRDRPFPCTVCSKRFLSRSHYHEHQRVHTGERPYPCNRCDRTFTTHHNRKRHQMIHDKEEAYRCSACGVLFCQEHQLGDLSGIMSVLEQHDVMEPPESPLEPETKRTPGPNLEEDLKLKHKKKKKKKRKHKGVCLDKDRSPSVEGQCGRAPSDSTHPQVYKSKVVDVPGARHQTGYRIQTVAYDIEIVL